MNDTPTSRLISSRSMKLAAGGVSLVALALLAMLAVGLFTDDTDPTATDSTPTARDS